jgi:hypothetical protein
MKPIKVNITKTKKKKSSAPKSQTKKAISIPREITEDADLAKYYLALTDPFHPGAVGAKVPDQYSCPTAVQTVRASFTITVNSSGNAGVCVFPNPVTSVACFNGACSDFSTITWGDNTTTTQARWGVDPTTFAAKLDNYRIVGYGIRVTGLSSMTNASGKFILGAYPVTSAWITKDFPVGGTTMTTNANLTQFRAWNAWGIPTNGSTLSPGLFVNLPGSKVISAIEASEKVFGVTPRLSSPDAMNFRDSGDNYAGTDLYPGATTGGDSDYLEMRGFEACYVYYTGGVASTSTMDLEIVYHLEGKPNLNTGTTQAVVGILPSASAAQSPVKPAGMLKVLETAARQPVVKEVIEMAANFIHPMFGKLAGSVLSLF